MTSKTYAECVAELPTNQDVPGILDYQKTEHSLRLKFVAKDGYLKPMIFTNLDDLAQLTLLSCRVQMIYETREIRYKRRKFDLAR